MTYDIMQSSTQSALVFFLVQSSDHITGKTGATPGVSISKNGASFVLVSGTVAEIGNGWYKVGGNVTDSNTLGPLGLHATATSADPADFVVANIVSYNPQDVIRLGITALPLTVCTTNNSLITSGAGTDQLYVASGQAFANVRQINSVSTSSVTTVNANIGMTQPINFTGTGASALVQSDMVDIAGAAVNTTTAQIGANIVNIRGTVSAGAVGYVGIDWSAINAPTTSVALSKTTISTSQVISQVFNSVGSVAGNVTGTISTSQIITSVTGSVGSVIGTISTSQVITQVTGSVGSVTGAVGSVTGAVGSVTGNVGGNVVGSVASVTGNIGGTISTSQIITQVTGSVGSVAGNVIGTISTSQIIASVTGSVGSVTGAVGSVTGAVGSVTGNVGGNVVGSVASVVGNVGGTISTSQTITQVTGSVGSVTGNIGGTISTSQVISSVTGSVGSVTSAVAITSNRKKGATATFEFLMQDSTTGAPATGLTVASTISKDGGAAASTANAVTEIGLGQYQIVLTGTEMTANNIFLQFTAASAITANVFVQTQP